MGVPLTTPPVAACKDNGYDGRFEQMVDDAVISITWLLSVLEYPVATKINDPEITKQQFLFHLYSKITGGSRVYIE